MITNLEGQADQSQELQLQICKRVAQLEGIGEGVRRIYRSLPLS